MRRYLLLLLLFGLTACEVATSPEENNNEPPPPGWHPQANPDHLVVVLNDVDTAEGLAADFELEVIQIKEDSRLVLYNGCAPASAVREDPRTQFVQRNGLLLLANPVDITLGFYEGDFVDGSFAQQDAFADFNLPLVHPHTTGGAVRIAVLDTGVDPSHPAFAGRLELVDPNITWLHSDEFANGIDDDNDGEIDEAYGHGTHVAGIIASIAPNATIIPIRVLDSDGNGTAFDLAAGMLLAKDMGAHVINLSLVLEDEVDVIEDILRELDDDGVVVVAAGGNQPGKARFPASDSHAFGVGACTENVIAPFSASEDVRIFAPGVGIESSYPDERLAVASGTSMSCGVVSACAALLMAAGMDADDATGLLRNTAAELPGASEGIVSPYEAVLEWLDSSR